MSYKSLLAKCDNNYFYSADDYTLVRVNTDPYSKNLNILQFNICGMNDLMKFDNLLLFIDSLHTDVHLIVITETFVKSSNKYSFNIGNFTNVFSCRDDRSGGGIVIFIRDDIHYTVNSMDDGTLPFQYISVQLLEFNATNVCGIYRPPGSDTDCFLEFLEHLLCKNKATSDFIIVGDLNISVNKDSKIVSDYISTLLSHGMIVTNTFATRPTSGNILDHAICSFLNIDRVSNSTIECYISDHSFLFSKFTYKKKYITRQLEKIFVNYMKVNMLFDEFLSSTSFNISNPDATLQMIIKKYNDLVGKYSRTKQIQVKMKNSNNCPWMTIDLWNLIKEKNRTFKRFKQNMTNPVLKNRLEFLNKKIKSFKYYAKKNYFDNLFSNLNHKEAWKQINQFMKSSSNVNVESIIHNDVEYKEVKSVVNIFNDFFINVCTTSSTSRVNSLTNCKHLYNLKTNLHSFFLSPISDFEVFNIICSLNNSKGGGYDNIRNLVVKRNATNFSCILAKLFNVVFETGVYPSCLKIAKVIPIFKSGNSKFINNYRPISMLSVFDKILEKLIANRMTEYLNETHFFYCYQYGFRLGSGTDTALIEITDLIYRAFDNQEYMCSLFLDLHKAFDSIDHRLLLDKLYSYGFRGLSYSLMESYLNNRKQFVVMNGVESNILTIKCGVPQGSVLGPLLFLIFINDIAQLPLAGQIRLFADDTAIFYNSKDCLQALINMEKDVLTLMDYFSCNKISVNLSKTKFIIFHSPFLPHHDFPFLQVSNDIIERVDKFKYLGVMFDKHMSWDEHICRLTLGICPYIFLIRKLVSFVPTRVLKMIYFSFIHTRFYYAISTFGTAAKTKLKILQVLQNRCCKAIYRLPHLYPSTELYRNVALSILPINALFELHVSVYMYKCLKVTSTLSNIEFQCVNHRYTSRRLNFLKSDKIKTEYGRKAIKFIGPYLYNNLPNIIKGSENVFKFKKLLKIHLAASIEGYL